MRVGLLRVEARVQASSRISLGALEAMMYHMQLRLRRGYNPGEFRKGNSGLAFDIPKHLLFGLQICAEGLLMSVVFRHRVSLHSVIPAGSAGSARAIRAMASVRHARWPVRAIPLSPSPTICSQ